MHMWHLHYTGAQVAACSTVRIPTTASLIPPALPQKKGGETVCHVLVLSHQANGSYCSDSSQMCNLITFCCSHMAQERRAMHAAETRSASEVEGEGRNYHLPIIFLPSVAHPEVGHCTYQLQELKLTARRCPKATERPMAKGADPETSFLLRSVVARTHNTSWKVAMISIPSPWPALIPSESCMETRRKKSLHIST